MHSKHNNIIAIYIFVTFTRIRRSTVFCNVKSQRSAVNQVYVFTIWLSKYRVGIFSRYIGL